MKGLTQGRGGQGKLGSSELEVGLSYFRELTK